MPGKNFRKINGKSLFKYLLDKLHKCNFDEVYVDSDSSEIANYCKKSGYKFIAFSLDFYFLGGKVRDEMKLIKDKLNNE